MKCDRGPATSAELTPPNQWRDSCHRQVPLLLTSWDNIGQAVDFILFNFNSLINLEGGQIEEIISFLGNTEP